MRGFAKWLIVISLVGAWFVVGALWLSYRACACTPKWKAYVAATRSDLRFLVTAQESVLAANGRYSIAFDSASFRASTGVTVEILEATDSGWLARGTHRMNDGQCVIWVGRVASRPVVRDTVPAEGEPRCDMRRKRD